MNSLKTIIHTLFKRHLFVTNVVSCGGLLFLGDGIVQTIEKTHARKTKEDIVPHDFQRSGRMFIIGLMLGPFNHFWYKMLDKYIIGTGIKMVTKKIAADQAVAGPFFCTTFLIASGLLEGKPLKECFAEWKAKFITIYIADWCVWPPAQMINFYFLPTEFRVVYVSMVTLCWNSFLSYIKHKDIHLEEKKAMK
ncbi:mpv17-like protein 2 [Pomacea canaliculata]|uniref:mpv17-like protein 2 n=1 Tax=Pomacea canaliculata TaxID=400727 RepID=UPI000D72D267|nr:mpv17-like protein 2 [Pomacea canaliculata]